MNLFKMMQTGEGIEHLEEHLLNLDSEFRFKCRRCGKCCIHQETIIFNARDIYNIAKKKGMTVQEVVNAYTEAYIGRNSHIPIVHLLSNGPKGACPLLENGRCSVHDCKPTVCALFPLGRVIIGEKFGEPIEDLDNLQVKYMLNEHSCGSAKRVNTVRSWLAKFGIPENDEFYLLWNKVLMSLTSAVIPLRAVWMKPIKKCGRRHRSFGSSFRQRIRGVFASSRATMDGRVRPGVPITAPCNVPLII